MLKDKILLITGGTGSFGQAVLNKYLNLGVKEIRILSRDEKKQEDMRIAYANEKIKFYLGDVRDQRSIDNAIFGVDFVFHAAALKQVPSCEFYPMEAVKTNIIGAENLFLSAQKHKVNKIIVLSTDKAVYPINAMGISKAMMERLMIAKSRIFADSESGPVLAATRYGNVMASRGSVIPLFVEQIKSGAPLTVTDPSMSRFVMTLPESVSLVEHAFLNAVPGDIFVQKAPAVTIQILAEALLDIFNADNHIKVIGTRHGEKLYETLLTREEMIVAEDQGGFFRVPADNRDLNYAKYFSHGKVINNNIDDYHSHNAVHLSKQDMIDVLMQLDYIKAELNYA